ncbi:ThiF family adenylyltransferase [Amycolatopsis sp.]|uniref:ThiF family adenylyltransferase n=1 Tax=Amycolatopsis sp. TaxID=37632 RepID=UPI002CFB5516|nr:ThiF family adenylyltransferase [Amycolatopsis sp.]HVV12774.1 ThiF family adenylyltransferase [Amycolatopsis sp.]
MVHHAVNPPTPGWSLTIPPRLWSDLQQHLFRLDDDEHGAVILAGRADGPRGPRLLARELILAADGLDYVEGTTGYRALKAEFVRDAALRARDEKLAYLAVHNHFGTTTVGFSRTDLASHDRGYPALSKITGQIVGGLVLTPQAAAGDFWLPDRTRVTPTEVVIPGGNLIRLTSAPGSVVASDARHDRQARLFGDRGQHAFGRMRVAVVGLGGVGSIVTELLARLGVGHLDLIDRDTADETNLARLLAAEPDDIGKPKTELAARNARRANPKISLTLIPENVQHPTALQAIAACDWIFLAADTNAARHWVNETVHRYLIPATQAGVKIPVDPLGQVGRIHVAVRHQIPGNGCMWCNGLINPTELAVDMLPNDLQKQARYLDEIPAPSVIALNSLAAGEAVNHFMFAITNLHADEHEHSLLHFPRTGQRIPQQSRRDSACRTCSDGGLMAQGGHAEAS